MWMDSAVHESYWTFFQVEEKLKGLSSTCWPTLDDTSSILFLESNMMVLGEVLLID